MNTVLQARHLRVQHTRTEVACA